MFHVERIVGGREWFSPTNLRRWADLPGLLQRIFGREQRAQRAEPIVYVQPRVATSGNLGSQPSKDALLREVKGWAAIAAKPIADRVMDLPWEVVEKRFVGEEVETVARPNHILQDIIDNPGPLFSKQLLLKVITYHVLFAGEAFVQKVTNQMDATRQLWPLPTHLTDAIYGETGEMVAVRVRSSQGERTLPAAEVIRIWCPDPLSLVGAMGVLGPQAAEWNTLRAMIGVEESHFENGAIPSVALKAQPGSPTPPADDEFAEFWSDRYNWKLGRFPGIPAILPEGYDPVEFGQHKNIGDLKDLGDQYAHQMLAAFGVPGSIVGEDKDVNRATAEANQFVFDRHTVSPLTSLISGAMTQQLAKDFGDSLCIRFAPFVAPDKDFELKREEQDLRLFVRPINEVRSDRGLRDDVDWGDEPVAGVGQVPYRPDDSFDALLGVDEMDDPRGERSDREEDEEDGARAIFERQLSAERDNVRVYARTVRGLFETQRRDVLRRYAEATRDLGDRFDGARVSAPDLFDPESWLPVWLRRLLARRQRVFEAEAVQTQAELSGGDFHFTEAAESSLRNQAAIDAIAVNEVTKRRIERVLQKGVAEGLSVQQVAKGLSSIFRDRARATRIARTEIGAAFTAGQLAGAESSQVVTEKVWRTSLDGAVRDTHAALEGESRVLAENFNVNGSNGAGPRDPSLPIGERANCRCFLEFRTAED